MVGSLQDQLLKLGLVTEEQLAEARTKPKRAGEERPGREAGRGRRDTSRRDRPRGNTGGARRDTAPRDESSAARPDGAAPGAAAPAAAAPAANEAARPAGRRRRRGAQGGRARGASEAQGAAASAPAQGRKAERRGAQTPQIDPAERALRDRVHGLITERAEGREQGETPYHFVKGSRIKRIYVTEAQRDRLASGELAVAAMKGRHYLVPMAVAEEIRGLIPAYFVAMGASHTPAGDGSDIDEEYAEYQVPDDLTW